MICGVANAQDSDLVGFLPTALRVASTMRSPCTNKVFLQHEWKKNHKLISFKTTDITQIKIKQNKTAYVSMA